MSSTWPFLHLNHLTPENDPIGSTSADDLTFPVDSADLSRQLEAWTNITFAFDDDGDQSVTTPGPFNDLKKDHLFEGAKMERSFSEDPSGSSTARADLDTLLGGSSNPYNPRRGVGTSVTTSSSSSATPHPLFARAHDHAFRDNQLGGGLGLPQELRQPTFGGAVVSGHGGVDQPQHVYPHDLGVLFPSTTGAQSASIQSGSIGGRVNEEDLFASLPLHWGMERNAASTSTTNSAAAGFDGLEGLVGLADLAAAHSAQTIPVPAPTSEGQGPTQVKGKKGASNTSSPAGSTESSTPTASSSKRSAGAKGEGASAKAGGEAKGKTGQGNASSSGKDEQPAGEDEASRIAIEEDKRRRNTAASARFRVKKKLREQAIERTAAELRERVGELEKEVEGLKKENGWLRGLIVDRAARDASANVSTTHAGSSPSARSASASRSSSAAASTWGEGRPGGEAHSKGAPVVAGAKRGRNAED